MRRWYNRTLAFDKASRLRFLKRIKILLENDLPATEIIQYVLETADLKPIVTLMESAMLRQNEGEPWATDWADDGYFTRQEALLLTTQQASKEKNGLLSAITQMIEDEQKTMTFWAGILETRKIHVLVTVFMLAVIVYISQGQRDTFAVAIERLGGEVTDIKLVALGDFLIGPFPIIVGVFAFILFLYRRVRESIVDPDARLRFNRLGFFKIYDRIFEYNVISTVTSFTKLGSNTNLILDSLSQIYRSPYQAKRIGEVIAEVELESKDLVDAMRGHVLSEQTYRLLKLAAPKEEQEVIARAFELTKEEVQVLLRTTYDRLSSIPFLVAVLAIGALIFGILDISVTMQEASDNLIINLGNRGK